MFFIVIKNTLNIPSGALVPIGLATSGKAPSIQKGM